jgi:asparagine synthase (glutamine-hydrolysing)
MCGICGIVDSRSGADVRRAEVGAMSALIAHRGPDHEGIRTHGACGLGHRRLAITDLVTGQQPLSNEDGTVWVVFNGEIYNYKQLRAKLERLGHSFVTQTDTEVIPHLYEEYGDSFMTHMEGNWAIGLWDERRSRLLLSRDRLGKKPLLWTTNGGVIRFASEAKALLACTAVPREPSMAGMLDVLTYGYVTEANTMFAGVQMVLPATTLLFESGSTTPTETRYWDFASVAEYSGTLEDAKAEFCQIMSDVTRGRLIGDVPYGLMLSGGIDSTLVASFIVEHEPALKTYTMARGDAEDETTAAMSMARHIGSDHHEIPLDAIDPVAVGARIPWMFDQPFFNDATFANDAVAAAISGELTVAITGDGGDHAFSGTTRHLGEEIAAQVARAPAPVLAAAAAGSSIGTRLAGSRPTFRRTHQLLRVSQTRPERRWLSLHQQNLPISYPHLLGPLAIESQVRFDAEREALGYYRACKSEDHLNRILYAELKFQLPPNDLLKVDRTCMYHNVAGRAPLLDRRIIEFAASLPATWKRTGRSLKWLLRQVAADRIPADLVGAPKVGLAVPLRAWLRGDLGAKVAQVVASRTFAERGIFNQPASIRAVERHRRGRADYGYAVWTMAMIELWYRSFIDQLAEPSADIWA